MMADSARARGRHCRAASAVAGMTCRGRVRRRRRSLTLAAVGGKAGTTNGEPALGANETGRVGPHGHKVSDPGHTHKATSPVSMTGNRREAPIPISQYVGNAAAVSVKRAWSGISVQPSTGSHYPLAYVLACVRK